LGSIEEISKLLNNAVVAFFFSVVVMTLIYAYSVVLWTDLFSITTSWVLTDFFFSLLIAGGSGIFIFKPFNTETLHKGKAYLVFYAMIVFSTLLSSAFIDAFLKSTETSQDVVTILGTSIPHYIIFTNFVAGILVFVDMNTRFYQRQKH